MHRVRSDAHVSQFGLGRGDRNPILPIANPPSVRDAASRPGSTPGNHGSEAAAVSNDAGEQADTALPPPAPPPTKSEEQQGSPAAVKSGGVVGIFKHFCLIVKEILLSSIFNVLLVFVPAGIALNYAGVPPYVIFAVNAVAIIPLAGLLSHATEAVAASLGDALGALLNVTFGNAVELIIFIIALAQNEIRIVQASLVGSILANLLLILGMCFLFGGLRFREQIYNSTVTQMSACLLSLSVTSLVLPTAFYASFSNVADANFYVLQLSRGTSIVLLLVYILYLLFQLKSHAYMYESTPQHIIDEESHPGVLANMLNSSESSSDDGAASSDSTDSNTTTNRIKKAFRRRRKSSASSKDASSSPSSSAPHTNPSDDRWLPLSNAEGTVQDASAVESGDEADTDGRKDSKKKEKFKVRNQRTRNRNAGDEDTTPTSSKSSQEKKSKRKSGKHRGENTRQRGRRGDVEASRVAAQGNGASHGENAEHTTRVAFTDEPEQIPKSATEPVRRPFASRTFSSVRPSVPKILTSTVFSTQNATGSNSPAPRNSSVPRAPYGLRRTSSLPGRLNRPSSVPRTQTRPGPPLAIANTITETMEAEGESENRLSRTSAIVLLLVSTALVALCAEFLVNSINYMVSETPIKEAFIGLIILPIVGNAAEHVTAVTVASKNKMDLAIGVAVGSSIQIALFVTPVVVLLGWCMGKEMSLYFTLFETVSLFVSAFIINFLILDGRSNYLEGALLMAAYVIIAVAAFYYPNHDQQSQIGGSGAAMLARQVSAVLTGGDR